MRAQVMKLYNTGGQNGIKKVATLVTTSSSGSFYLTVLNYRMVVFLWGIQVHLFHPL